MTTWDVMADFLEESGYDQWAKMVRAAHGEGSAIRMPTADQAEFRQLTSEPGLRNYRFPEFAPHYAEGEFRWVTGTDVDNVIKGEVASFSDDAVFRVKVAEVTFEIPVRRDSYTKIR